MAKLRSIIVDDESAARDVLERLLIRNCPSIEVLDKCHDVESAVEKIKELKPDVVFLDVQMPNYAGYEIVDFFDAIDFEIIFVTAYDQYAIKAFELSAVDYLVKPVNRQRLIESIEKLDEKIKQKNGFKDYQILKDSIQNKQFDKIIISELGNKRVLLLKDIIAIEAKGAYSTIHLVKDKNILVSKNLKHFESVLPEDNSFFRSHKSWIISTEFINAFNKNKGEISLNQGSILARLSKYKIQEFEELDLVFKS
jgi:two-component system LytT family response regulator